MFNKLSFHLREQNILRNVHGFDFRLCILDYTFINLMFYQAFTIQFEHRDKLFNLKFKTF